MNTISSYPSFSQSSEIWSGLRQAIAGTPGFQYWCSTSLSADSTDLDALVRLYLRETLETLAY